MYMDCGLAAPKPQHLVPIFANKLTSLAYCLPFCNSEKYIIHVFTGSKQKIHFHEEQDKIDHYDCMVYQY